MGMNKTTEALKYDILVLKIAARFLHKAVSAKERCDYWIVKELIAKKEMQLAEPVKQEPVMVGYLDVGEGGYLDIGTDLTDDQIRERLGVGKHNLYAAPVSAKREWVDLTDDEILMCVKSQSIIETVRRAFVAFKEKQK